MLLLLSGFADSLLLNSGENIYLSVIVIQVLVLIIPTVFYTKLKGDGYVSRLRLRLFDADKFIVVLLAAAAMILGSMIINVCLSALGYSLGQFSLYETYASPSSQGFSDALYVIIAFAVLPAIAEEFLFRSVIIAEYEKSGILCAVFMSSLMFAMLHFSLANLPVYLFCGAMLALVTYVTRSVLAAVAAHFLYNMFGLFGQSYVNSVIAQLQNYVLFVFILVALFLLVLIFAFGEAERIYHNFAMQNKPSDYAETKKQKSRFALFFEAFLSPAFLMCLILYLIIIAGL